MRPAAKVSKERPYGLAEALNGLRGRFAAAAQAVYDQWDPSDPEHGDPELGFGGICQDVAAALCQVVADSAESDSGGAGLECVEIPASVGDQHVFMGVLNPVTKEAFTVDIAPGYYETGAAYTWKKIPGVRFQPDWVDIAPARFEDLADLLEGDS